MTDAPDDFERLLAHAGFVRALARDLVFDANVASDVEQEIWLAALQNVPRGLSSPRAWLATVARNFAKRGARGDSRRRRREEISARPEGVPSSSEILEREQMRAELVESVLALEEPYRSTIVLRYLEELSPSATADRLGIPAETVRTRTKRGLEKLRESLERRHGSSFGLHMVALVDALRLEPSSTARLAVSIAKGVVAGGLVVGSQIKLAGVGIALVVCALAVWWMNSGERFDPLSRSHAVDTALVMDETPRAASERSPLDPSAPVEIAENTPSTSTTTAAVAKEFGDLVVRIVRKDGKPGARIGVQLDAASALDPFANQHFGTSDESGAVRFAGVRAGSASVQLDRWMQEHRVRVPAGGVGEIKIELPAAGDVSGKVVDASGAPVADAEIVLSGLRGDWGREVLTRSAADGTFRVDALAGINIVALFARAPDRAPTPRVLFTGPVRDERDVVLTFEEAGGAIEGRVLGPSGEPVRGARVLVGDAEVYRPSRSKDGREYFGAPAYEVLTDEDGHFVAPSVATGSIAVKVRPRVEPDSVLAMWQGTIDVHPRATSRSIIHLERGVVVEGVVYDVDGKADSGIPVETNDGWGWETHRGTTGGSGRFVLGGMSAGSITIRAHDGSGARASVTFDAQPGDVVRRDLRLDRGITLRGRIVASGRLNRFAVEVSALVPAPRQQSARASVGRDGTFEIAGLNDEDYVVVVMMQGTRRLAAKLDRVRPSANELVIEVPEPGAPAKARGRVVRADGTPVVGADVHLFCMEPPESIQERADASGRFEVTQLVAGLWSAQFSFPGLARTGLPRHEVASGDVWDMGDVVLPIGGTISVHVRLADGRALERAFVTVGDRASTIGSVVMLTEGRGRSESMPAGAGWLVVRDIVPDDVALACVPIDITAGVDVEHEVVLVAGTRVTVHFAYAGDARVTPHKLFVLRGADQRPFSSGPTADPTGALASPSFVLPAGSYRIEAWPSERVLDTFDVPAPGGAEIVRRITLGS